MPLAVVLPAIKVMALFAALVVEIASVMLKSPLRVLMFTAPVALTPVGFTVASVKLPAFTKLRLPISWAAKVVTLFVVSVNVALPPSKANPAVVIMPLAFWVIAPLVALRRIIPLLLAVNALFSVTLPP